MSGISSDYATLYDYYPAQGVVHCKNCPKIFKFHPQKTGYTTIKEHYATTHPEEFSNLKFLSPNVLFTQDRSLEP